MKRPGPAHLVVVAALAAHVAGVGAQQQFAAPPAALAPTNHPRLPRDLSQLWMVPESGRPWTAAQNDFVTAVRLELADHFAKALPLLDQPALAQGPLAMYAEYYAASAKLRLGRLDEAGRALSALEAKNPVGYLAQAVAYRQAEWFDAKGDYTSSLAVYERLVRSRTIATEEVLMRLAHAAKEAGDSERAAQVWARVYYEYPLSDQALAAGAELISGVQAGAPSRFRLQLQRAERLYNAKRHSQARTEFMLLRAAAADDMDRQLVDLRIAECEYYLKRYRNAKTALASLTDRALRQSEALHFYALTLLGLHETDEYQRVVRRIVTAFPADPWTDAALNELATHYIQQDQDDLAEETFRDLYARFPTGPNAERAAWKVGWWAYRSGRDAETARVFERAAVDFPRSDYRPMWLYWSGRAHERLKAGDAAIARYTLAVADYGNSYYGRLARTRLEARGVRSPVRRLVLDAAAPPTVVDSADAQPAVVPLPPNAATIRALLAIDLYDQAIDELRYAQKAWGTSAVVEATLAWTYWQQGRSERAMDQLTLYRAGMNAMKRAYPHYLAAGGEELPIPLLRIIFPLMYWDEIQKYAASYDLDPYVAAALVAQESTFVPDVKSYANAWGLTQLLPSTARQYAKVVKLRYSAKLLTDPDANLRMGMAYFRDKIKEFGSVTLALASYNAGERAVHRWVLERPGVPDDEFIDDIPYPQTNLYVKKILGTAEDYRRLYASDQAHLEARASEAAPTIEKAAPKAPAKATPQKRSSSKKPGSASRPRTKKAGTPRAR